MRWLGVATAVAGMLAAASGGGWSIAQPVPGVTIQGGGSEYSQPGYVGASCSSPLDCTVVYQPSGNGKEPRCSA